MKRGGREDAAAAAGTRPAAPASGIRVQSTDAGRASERPLMIPTAFRGLRDSDGRLLIEAEAGADFVILGRPARWLDDSRGARMPAHNPTLRPRRARK